MLPNKIMILSMIFKITVASSSVIREQGLRNKSIDLMAQELSTMTRELGAFSSWHKNQEPVP